jgi:hypothetical protein
MSAAAGVNTVNIFPPTSKPYDLTYEEHVKNFWKWVISLPINMNPWKDKTGKNCANGQLELNSSVFYLSGNGGETTLDRKCNVPAGKGLFIPIAPSEVSDKEYPNTPVGNIEDPYSLHGLAKTDQDKIINLYLIIGDKEYTLEELKKNGKEYNTEELKKYRIHTKEDFQVIFPKIPPGENAGLFGVTEAGPSKAVADGHYVITEPLKKGNYTIYYEAFFITGEEGKTFEHKILYHITVE